MPDAFASYSRRLDSPATAAKPIVPNDITGIDTPRSIYVGTAGDIVMRGVDSPVDNTWKNVPAGTILPFRPSFVRATGTTASNMLALY